MTIEKAIRSDAQSLTELTIRSKSHWNYGVKQIEEWRDDLTITSDHIEQSQIYKLVGDGLLKGFYAYDHINKSDIKLTYLFIDPLYIGTGLGSILVKDFFGRIESTNYERVILDADPNAEQFYSKLGFQVIGQLKSSIKDRFLPIMEIKRDQISS